MSTTAWLVRNSQTPSEAMTKKAVSSFTVRLLTSGVAITPISSATAPPHQQSDQDGTLQKERSQSGTRHMHKCLFSVIQFISELFDLSQSCMTYLRAVFPISELFDIWH